MIPKDFRTRLLAWFEENKRPFPWREPIDPYVVFVSEVMLQQTQASRIAERLPLWLDVFPDIRALAAAPASAVLREWSGLGYNRRALALHAAAKEVVARFGGVMPKEEADLLTLPGVGPYTAAAVRAFAYNLPAKAIDVNLLRVLQRLFHPGETATTKEVGPVMDELLTEDNARELTSALMDFGSTICTAVPKCRICPMQDGCPSAFRIIAIKRTAVKKEGKFPEPRRIYRGRVMKHLMGRRRSTKKMLLRAADPAATKDDMPWIDDILESLEKDGLIVRHGLHYYLPE